MKKKILLFTAIAGMGYVIFTSATSGPARSGYDCTGAETACTGSYANPSGCAAAAGCHGSAATSTITATIELDSAGVAKTQYKPGVTYTVKITGNNGSSTTFTKYGFQLTSIKGAASAATVSNAGTWSTTVPTGTHLQAPGTYTLITIAEHSAPITMSGTSFSQSFTWTAPATGTGTISFWGAANFVNNDGRANAPDFWNTGSLVVTEMPASTTSIASTATGSFKAFPNPVNNTLNLEFGNTEAGAYSVNVFDMSGKCISNQNIDATSANYVTSLNTSNWTAGIYNVVLENNGTRTVTSVVKN